MSTMRPFPPCSYGKPRPVGAVVAEWIWCERRCDEVYGARICEECEHRTQAAIADARGGLATRVHTIRPYRDREETPAQKGESMPKPFDWDAPMLDEDGEDTGMDKFEWAKAALADGKSLMQVSTAVGCGYSTASDKLKQFNPKATGPRRQHNPAKPKPAPASPAAAPVEKPAAPPATLTAATGPITTPPIVADGVTGYTLPTPPANQDGKTVAEALHDITARCSTTPLLEAAVAGDLRDFIRYRGLERTAETFLGIKQYLAERAR